MTRRFSRKIFDAIRENKMLGIRAGADSAHRFIGIWAVGIDGRVFARSWTIKPAGWYRTLMRERVGSIRVGEREVRIRASAARGTRIREAVDRAYAEKYSTPGSLKYVRGLRSPRRQETTVELLPR
jgi:hypothetical protein